MAATLGLSLARKLIPLYIRNQYSATAAYNALRSRYDLNVPRRAFFDNFKEIKSGFDFSPALRRLDPFAAVPRTLIVPSAHPQGARYEYTIRFDAVDPQTGETRSRFATIFSSDRLSARGALEQLHEQQAEFDPERREYLARLERTSQVYLESVKEFNVRNRIT